jgi:hypothetical protein
MSLSVKGKLTSKLPVESGTSKAGKEWIRQSIVIDTGDQYNPLICISFFGDKAELLKGLKKDDELEVFINISSREFETKWFHNIDGWKVIANGAAPAGAAPAPAAAATNDAPAGDDDLPF